MNRHRKESRRRQVLPVWSYYQAQQACPYIASIMRSLREHRLEEIRQRLKGQRLAARLGRPDRAGLMAQDEARRNAQLAGDRALEDLRELHGLGVYCQDPVQGQALLPFVHGHLLAWLVFDLFEKEPLHAWRYHSDPDDTRRPIAEVADSPAEWTMVL